METNVDNTTELGFSNNTIMKERKIKIAICISGHLRDGDKLCYPSLKKYLLDKYDTDIFVSSFKESGANNYATMSDHPVEDDNDVSSIILDTYKPKRYNRIDANANWLSVLRNKYNDISTRNGTKVWQVAAMHRNIYDAQRLRREYEGDTGTKYDLVIRTRFDNEFISDSVAALNYKSTDGMIFKSGHCGVFDQTFWGGPSYMNMTADCWFYISDIVNKDNCKSYENAENIFTTYLKLIEMPVSIRDDIKISITKTHGSHIT